MAERCPFTGGECDGGTAGDGWAGCGYKDAPDSRCLWADDVPESTSPRDFYNDTVMEVLRS